MDHESGMGAKAPLSGYKDCNLHDMTKEQVRQWLSEKQISKDVVDSLYGKEYFYRSCNSLYCAHVVII